MAGKRAAAVEGRTTAAVIMTGMYSGIRDRFPLHA
jgi:hypothetical protein